MDEIHKYPEWKNVLKDFFDSFGEKNGFIVTGSARLDMMRKSGDSLAGRYFTFRLNPITLRELTGKSFLEPPADANDWIMQKLDHPTYKEKELYALLRFSGFPEPLLSTSVRFHNKWRTDYVDRLIREDMRDLTRIQELENIATLMFLLPSKIALPLSINSLTANIKCSFATVSNYLKAMELGYLIFRILPYSKKIARSLTAEVEEALGDCGTISRGGVYNSMRLGACALESLNLGNNVTLTANSPFAGGIKSGNSRMNDASL